MIFIKKTNKGKISIFTEELLKYEIAMDMGIYEKIKELGIEALTDDEKNEFDYNIKHIYKKKG